MKPLDTFQAFDKTNLCGYDNDRQIRLPLADAADQLRPIHERHTNVGHQQGPPAG